MTQPIVIARVTAADLPDVAPLFDAYRQFYDCAPDAERARDFLAARLKNDEAVIFLARDGDGTPLGFTQLYPSFCSVDVARIWILYDLFVAPAARQRGVGRALMNRARQLAEETGAAWIGLNTAIDNVTAQALYEDLGYRRDDGFYTYVLRLDD